ncbi:flavonoid 3'-monooxygenase CYP75B4-like [Miscanthus floridulus]|uniref:flavonoid 3'-monooxygenase CYP75B4-like n=1 Tax=Miscanthus floridulus TaxID=154761 RepID=UPI00345A76A0
MARRCGLAGAAAGARRRGGDCSGEPCRREELTTGDTDTAHEDDDQPGLHDDDILIDQLFRPKLLVNVWGIARDLALWPDPLQFRPSRFLPGPGGYGFSETEHYGYGFIPLGAGRRVCAGRSWGTRMVALACATLVHAFDWELPAGQTPGDLVIEEALTLLLQRAVPLMLRPVPRLLPSAYEIIS